MNGALVIHIWTSGYRYETIAKNIISIHNRVDAISPYRIGKIENRCIFPIDTIVRFLHFNRFIHDFCFISFETLIILIIGKFGKFSVVLAQLTFSNHFVSNTRLLIVPYFILQYLNCVIYMYPVISCFLFVDIQRHLSTIFTTQGEL